MQAVLPNLAGTQNEGGSSKLLGFQEKRE